MTQEQKAKAHDESLERAKEYLNSPRTCFDIEQLYNIFPELKESEDERIRGAIMHFISHTPTVPKGIISKEQMLAWLEKQGQQKPVEWSEEDEQYLLVCKNALRKYQVTDKWDSEIISQWLDKKIKSTKQRIGE